MAEVERLSKTTRYSTVFIVTKGFIRKQFHNTKQVSSIFFIFVIPTFICDLSFTLLKHSVTEHLYMYLLFYFLCLPVRSHA